MSVRNGLLAILDQQPRHGHGLTSEFEKRTAGVWPLNVGQIHTTLERLQRDGLVAPCDPDAAAADAPRGSPRARSRPAAGPSVRQSFTRTPAGRTALEPWYATPVVDDPPGRDESTIKVLLAVAAGTTDVTAVTQRQRAAAMERLQQSTRRKLQADPQRDLTWRLLLDALILKAEAGIRWLDLCDERLRQRARP